MLLSNAPAVSINPKPTRADAEAALELLKGLLVEMPFVGEADRSVALSLIISLVLRAALETPPLHAYASPHSGAGKSLIVNISSMIASGRKCAVMGATRIGEELEKKINSALLAGRALISLDNFNGVLSSGLLCQALTEPVVMVRPLGRSTEVPIASRFVFAATGNNLQITDDLDRRVLLAKLDAKMGRPFERQFKQRPLEMIAQDRARYIAAALTIPLAYIAAGYPGLPPELNSFTRWSKLVRGPLMWLGEADPVLTLLAAIESDPKVQASAAMLVALRDAFGMGPGAKCTKQEIIDAIDPREIGGFQSILGAPIERPAKQKALREALMGLEVEEGNDLSTKLTYWLRANNDRSISGLRLCSEFDKHSKVNKWYVELATE
jgi:putative DNA primase/helicase